MHTERIRGLDGLRAVAVLMVILCHCKLLLEGRLSPLFFVFTDSLAHSGVVLFFVVSGFLVTSSLLQNRERARPSFRPFLLKRLARVGPALGFYLLVTAVIGLSGLLPVNPLAWLSSATFTWNYAILFFPAIVTGGQLFAHGWTLCVEMQFYVLWGFLASRVAERKLIFVCIALILAAPVLRIASYLISPTHHGNIITFHSRMGAPLTGAFLALLCNRADALIWRKRLRLHPAWVGVVFLYLALVHPLLGERFLGRYLFTVGFGLEALLVAWIVFKVVMGTSNLFHWLSARPLVWLGRMSYSLYIWHLIFVDPRVFAYFGAWSFVLMAAATLFSYYCVELPSRKWLAGLGKNLWPEANHAPVGIKF